MTFHNLVMVPITPYPQPLPQASIPYARYPVNDKMASQRWKEENEADETSQLVRLEMVEMTSEALALIEALNAVCKGTR